MKKRLLFVCILLLSAMSTISAQHVDLGVRIDDVTGAGPGNNKSPIEIPYVWQDDHLITLSASHPEYVLNLVDSNDTVVYSVIVPATVSLVQLPASLTGTYELQLIQGNLCFYGDITL